MTIPVLMGHRMPAVAFFVMTCCLVVSCSPARPVKEGVPPMDPKTIKAMTEDLLNQPEPDRQAMSKNLGIEVDDKMFEAYQADRKRAIDEANRSFASAKEHLEFARKEEEAKRFDAAILHYGRALLMEPAAPEPYAAVANLKRLSGKVDDAIRMYDAALAIAPDRPGWLFSRGELLYVNGRTADAVLDFEQAIMLKPGLAQAYASLAVARWKLSEYAKAWEAVEQCQRLGGEVREDFLEKLSEDSGRPVSHPKEDAETNTPLVQAP